MKNDAPQVILTETSPQPQTIASDIHVLQVLTVISAAVVRSSSLGFYEHAHLYFCGSHLF